MGTGRYAPSPTGDLHLGNLRTAVVAWLLSRHDDSRFLLRIEDLDPASRSGEHEAGQLNDLRALGVDWDGPPMRQSERIGVYAAAIDQLVVDDLVFECFCSRREIREATRAAHDAGRAPGYPGTCRHLTEEQRARRREERPAALRLRRAAGEIEFDDRIAGTLSGPVDDLVLRRNDGTPAYNLAVVVDDAAQGVELVVRGDDLLPATPAQLHLHDLLGTVRPAHGHVPLVLGPSGDRLAKRDGAVSLGQLRASGRSVGEILGWMGHSLGIADDGEHVDLATLHARFDPASVDWTTWTVTEQQIASA